jgi:hypothetical protein
MATQSALDTNTTMQTPQQQPGNLVPMEAHPLQTGVPGRLYSPHDRVGPILDAMAAFHRGFTRQDMYAVYKAGGTRAVDAVLSNEELLKNKYPVKQVIDGIRAEAGLAREETTRTCTRAETVAPASAPATIAESINHYTNRVQLSAEEWDRLERGAGPSGPQ